MTGNQGTADRSSTPQFFVVGVQRSGTTMLGRMLDNHPDLAVPHEPRFISDLWRRRSRYGRDSRVERPDVFLDDLGSLPRFLRWKLPVSAVRTELERFPSPTFGDAIEAVFMAHAHRAGKPRWAGKAPQYVDDIPLLARMFPRAVFVHLIRDGRDVALSSLALEHMHAHAATVAYVWSRSVRRARVAGSRLARTITRSSDTRNWSRILSPA